MTGVSSMSSHCGPLFNIVYQTPLNNNIRELFNLMNFLDCDKWEDLEALEKEYEELSEELVRQLHVRLKPYFLRRIKSEVLQLPPKVCTIPIALSPLNSLVRTRLSCHSRLHHCKRRSTGQFSVRF